MDASIRSPSRLGPRPRPVTFFTTNKTIANARHLPRHGELSSILLFLPEIQSPPTHRDVPQNLLPTLETVRPRPRERSGSPNCVTRTALHIHHQMV